MKTTHLLPFLMKFWSTKYHYRFLSVDLIEALHAAIAGQIAHKGSVP